MSFRCFAAADEEHAAGWADAVETTIGWTLGPAIGTGESGSFHIASPDGKRGACKPAFAGDTTPRAAHEKISSDLAFQLSLPVPAICLWTNPSDQSRYAISAWAFSQAMTWGEVATRLTPTFMKNAVPAFSAARVFHTWIGDTDHGGNPGNVLVDVASDENNPRVAFIDHAFSMSHVGDFRDGPVRAVPFSYLPGMSIDGEATNKMIGKINQLEATMIENIVRRIPDPFLPAARVDAILAGLLRRRGELSALLGVV
jgi:hypothetical protein